MNRSVWRGLIIMHKENIASVDEIRSEVSGTTFKKRCYVYTKRTFDVLVSLIGILFLVPLILVIKIMYVCTGDFHSIFYSQERIGLRGKIFRLYKFRTMRLHADEILEKILMNDPALREEYEENKKLKNDPRITKAGKIVRKLSLDEFPQFINIFKGDMSFVGNRPYLPREREDMGEYYEDIVRTKPGLTGYWQTSGRSNTTFLYRLRMEKKYSNIQSFSLDIKIMFKTVVQLFKHDGAV